MGRTRTFLVPFRLRHTTFWPSLLLYLIYYAIWVWVRPSWNDELMVNLAGLNAFYVLLLSSLSMKTVRGEWSGWSRLRFVAGSVIGYLLLYLIVLFLTLCLGLGQGFYEWWTGEKIKMMNDVLCFALPIVMSLPGLAVVSICMTRSRLFTVEQIQPGLPHTQG